uniref:alpha-1,6-glucosidase domain-containing protein n=1 Tax=Agarivorans sp. TaxID=1872412 RepID=UPI003D032732
LDENNDAIVVVLNATSEEQTFPIEGATGFELHEVQLTSVDGVVQGASFADGKFTVPARTTAVFVQAQGDAQGAGLPVDSSNKDLSAIPPLGDTPVYVRGTMNNWETTNEVEFAGNGKYSVNMTLDAGLHKFKVFDSYSGDRWYGAAEPLVTLGEAKELADGSDLELTLDAKSVVSIVVDYSNVNVPILTVTASEVAGCELLEDSAETGPLTSQLAVRGSHSGWGWSSDYALTYKGNNTYQVALGAGDYEFKLAADTDNWDPQMIAYSGDARVENLVLNVDYQAWARVGNSAINDPGNNKITLAGDSVLTLNVDADLVDNSDNGTISLCELEQ